jgi:tol-pal system-associated acyl-CoA thioesterase
MKTKVYYADTDAGGVVYYGNYLRWLEMGRSELVESFGMSVAGFADHEILFAVVRIEVDYRVPAVLGDEVEIKTIVERVRKVRFTLQQRVVRCADGEELVAAKVTVACIGPPRRVVALPTDLAAALRSRCVRIS